MRVLVTGTAGQLARSFAEQIAVAAPTIDLAFVGRPHFDLAQPGTIEPAIVAACPDVVINAAAYTAVDRAEDEPDLCFAVNGEGPGRVAAAASRARARLIQISTDYVFDGMAEGAYREDATPRPLGVYGRSKLEGEQRARAEHPEAIIVRTAWVYSPFGRNFLKTMMALAGGQDELTIVGDQHGNPSNALDLAAGLVAMLAHWSEDPGQGLGQDYHLAGTGEASWAEFATCIFDACRDAGAPSARVRAVATSEWPTKAPRPRNSRLDSSAFARDFGYAMPNWRLSTEATVRRLVAAEHA